ncbi:MerR family transcriptional regulator [Streptomyces sp. V4-01]|uniref:MerR family transcriptional regulator n=1 Tax=Actinacidiphila polyblastidii TaxID=3110430 RepID=A0ABU7P3G7_9ACTN|nr:MerR family transcriptional regulator [Streptomyces sp. V4-01]
MDRTNLLPIGQFAQASGLAVSALRHYDTSGLLAPALTDPVSGYRYYHRDQVRTAQVVRGLRQLDVPLDRVRHLLERRAAGEDISAALRDHMARAEDRLGDQRTVLRNLLAHLSGGVEMNHHVTLRDNAPIRALACRADVDAAGLDAFMRTAFQTLYSAAGMGPLTLPAPAFARYHGPVTQESTSEVEACLPFAADAAQPGDLPDGVYVLDIAATTVAATAVDGPDAAFPQILSAYDALAAWITEHGFGFAGPVQETYHRWHGAPGHPGNSLELVWPVDDAE